MVIIGIAGGTGSGKTTVVKQLMDHYQNEQIGLLSQDSYYRQSSAEDYNERAAVNFDHPDSIDFELLKSHIKELKAGRPVLQPVYCFATHNRTQDAITTYPKKVIIVEGILILSDPALRDLLDIKVFVNADADERLIRRLHRDIAERGRDMDEVLQRYRNTLKPMHDQYIEPFKNFADIILPHDRYNSVGVSIIKMIIDQAIAQ